MKTLTPIDYIHSSWEALAHIRALLDIVAEDEITINVVELSDYLEGLIKNLSTAEGMLANEVSE